MDAEKLRLLMHPDADPHDVDQNRKVRVAKLLLQLRASDALCRQQRKELASVDKRLEKLLRKVGYNSRPPKYIY